MKNKEDLKVKAQEIGDMFEKEGYTYADIVMVLALVNHATNSGATIKALKSLMVSE